MTKQKKSNRFVGVVLETIGGPLLWGLIATFAFYFAVREGFVTNQLLVRYTAGHPVEYVEVALFFVGLVAVMRRGALALSESVKATKVKLQHRSSDSINDRVAHLLGQIESLPGKLRHSLFVRRLNDALTHVQRNETAEHLEDELKYLADVEAERSHDGYALVRMIIWATPMLGFLGTVIGITLALGDLSPEALVNSPKEAMEGLLSGLSVAFDTTALALTLSITLMFAQFVTQQLDTQLLSVLDRQATRELAPYFRRETQSTDPQTETLQRMAVQMTDAIQASNQRQMELWQKSLDQSHQQWVQLMQDTGQLVHEAVAGAIDENLRNHTNNLAMVEKQATEQASDNWQQWHDTAAETLQRVTDQQQELTRHGEVMLKVIQATGDVTQLETALNQNLRALAGAKNFEDTVMSLSAAIQLLTSRLGKPMPRDSQVKLDDGQERAA